MSPLPRWRPVMMVIFMLHLPISNLVTCSFKPSLPRWLLTASALHWQMLRRSEPDLWTRKGAGAGGLNGDVLPRSRSRKPPRIAMLEATQTLHRQHDPGVHYCIICLGGCFAAAPSASRRSEATCTCTRYTGMLVNFRSAVLIWPSHEPCVKGVPLCQTAVGNLLLMTHFTLLYY